MKVLVFGAGGREHAIITALLRDPAVTEVHAAPGNAGIARVVPVHRIDPSSPEQATGLAEDLDADLVVIGPEAPLVAGVADALREAGIPVFGPDAAAARLESSKAFAKEVMVEAGVPTAEAAVARDLEETRAAMDRFGAPYVIKDDGLAGGKGVVVTEDPAAAEAHAAACFEAGSAVVIEEYLDGPEVSLFVLCDGVHTVPLSPAQDFKRIGDDDAGPNTGGMGAYTPLPWLPEGFTDEVVAAVAQPVVDAMARRATPFVGVLYCGRHRPRRAGHRVQRPLRGPRDPGCPGPAAHPAGAAAAQRRRGGTGPGPEAALGPAPGRRRRDGRRELPRNPPHRG